MSLGILVSFLLKAQNLEFMGIPINGTIDSFQTKLLTKGCKLSKYSKDLPSGVRLFTGLFAGKECEIYVWYDVRTKRVFQVRAVNECDSSVENAGNTMDYYKDLLKKKYGDVSLDSDIMDDSKRDAFFFEMAIMQPPIEIGSRLIGFITINVNQYDVYPYNYYVAITYEDKVNKDNYEKNILDDL